MIQLTTPTHEFKLPFGVELVKKARVLYAQNDTVILKKETSDCSMQGNTISVTLSQQETNKFKDGENVTIQLRVLTTDDKALTSREFSVKCVDCLDNEVIA